MNAPLSHERFITWFISHKPRAYNLKSECQIQATKLQIFVFPNEILIFNCILWITESWKTTEVAWLQPKGDVEQRPNNLWEIGH